jgi:hypothetical protein
MQLSVDAVLGWVRVLLTMEEGDVLRVRREGDLPLMERTAAKDRV